jgi:hypothetical protein
MPSQREQYRNIVHLFIGTGRSPCKITLMPFTFINNSIVILRGLIWLFIFKSVSLSRCYAETLLHIASWSSYPSSWSPSQSSFVLTMLLYTRNLIPKVPARILRKHWQITFLRTFGSRRPPTASLHIFLHTGSIPSGKKRSCLWELWRSFFSLAKYLGLIKCFRIRVSFVSGLVMQQQNSAPRPSPTDRVL